MSEWMMDEGKSATEHWSVVAEVGFALLHHTGHGVEHYDLLLQVPWQEKLLTWRLSALPKASPTVERIADHRAIYMGYEGAISGERGEVRRLAAGRARVVEVGETAILLALPEPYGVTLRLGL